MRLRLQSRLATGWDARRSFCLQWADGARPRADDALESISGRSWHRDRAVRLDPFQTFLADHAFHEDAWPRKSNLCKKASGSVTSSAARAVSIRARTHRRAIRRASNLDCPGNGLITRP